MRKKELTRFLLTLPALLVLSACTTTNYLSDARFSLSRGVSTHVCQVGETVDLDDDKTTTPRRLNIWKAQTMDNRGILARIVPAYDGSERINESP